VYNYKHWRSVIFALLDLRSAEGGTELCVPHTDLHSRNVVIVLRNSGKGATTTTPIFKSNKNDNEDHNNRGKYLCRLCDSRIRPIWPNGRYSEVGAGQWFSTCQCQCQCI